MQSWRTVVLIALFATGMFLLSIGGDSLKVAHLGVKFVPIVWLALMFIVQQVCRHADKRIVAAFPEIFPPPSFGFVCIAGSCIALAGWWDRRVVVSTLNI